MKHLLLIFMMVPVMCSADCPDLKVCHEIKDDAERLACYDQLAANTPPALPVKPPIEYAKAALSQDVTLSFDKGVLSVVFNGADRVTDGIYNGAIASLCVPIITREATWEAEETHVLNRHGKQGYILQGGGDACLSALAAESNGLNFNQAVGMVTTTFNPDDHNQE